MTTATAKGPMLSTPASEMASRTGGSNPGSEHPGFTCRVSYQYRFSIGIPEGSDEYSAGTQGSYRNLRKTLFNVVFGLQQTAVATISGYIRGMR